MGGGARCSRRHSPRSSKIVAAESPASDSAMSIDDLPMLATATRPDAVTADVPAHLPPALNFWPRTHRFERSTVRAEESVAKIRLD
jgi:hypothetical protein